MIECKTIKKTEIREQTEKESNTKHNLDVYANKFYYRCQRILLENMRDEYNLHDRVELLGSSCTTY